MRIPHGLSGGEAQASPPASIGAPWRKRMNPSTAAFWRSPMPEMWFVVRWPDGSSETCYSPSLVIKEHFREGDLYAVPDFLERSRTALRIASDRVAGQIWPAMQPRARPAREHRIRRAPAFSTIPARLSPVNAFVHQPP